jgi:hypothetical protein
MVFANVLHTVEKLQAAIVQEVGKHNTQHAGKCVSEPKKKSQFMSRAKWRTLRASSLVNFYIVVLCLLLLITFFVYCNESSTFLHPKSEVKVALFYTKNCSDYSFHLSFVKNGPIKTQFYTFVTMVSKNWTEYSHSWKLYR